MNNNLKIYDAKLDDAGMLGIEAISLVSMPAIEQNFVALSDQKVLQAKVDEVRQMVYGPILIPDQLIYRKNDKTGEEYYIRYSADVIRQAAQGFMKKGNQSQVTIEHEYSVQGITFVEFWIKDYDQDKSNPLGFNLPVGTLFGGAKIDDPKFYELATNGALKGFSIEAWFDFSESEEQMIAQAIAQALEML